MWKLDSLTSRLLATTIHGSWLVQNKPPWSLILPGFEYHVEYWTHVHQLHWYYIDTFKPLQTIRIVDFISEFLQSIDNSVDKISSPRSFSSHRYITTSLKLYLQYRNQLPTAGGLPLSYHNGQWYVLVVQTMPSLSTNVYSPAKGKSQCIDNNSLKLESPPVTASRELEEEIGFCTTPQHLHQHCWSVDITTTTRNKQTKQNSRLYLIPGVSYTYNFNIKCHGEIHHFRWIPIRDDASPHNFSHLLIQIWPILIQFVRYLLPYANIFQTRCEVSTSFEIDLFSNVASN
jgi:hypothetical protein